MNTRFRETYVNKGTNAEVSTGSVMVIEDRKDSLINNNLPHNTMSLANLSATCTLFIYLDDYSDQNKPDYVLFPNSNMSINVEEGISFNTVWVKNTNTVNALLINELKYRISTSKEVL